MPGIVPGNLGGYLSLLDRFGTMTLGEVFAPAIEYAEKGYPIDPMLAADINRGRNNLSKYPTTAKIYLPGGQPPAAGDLLKNPDYAGTLRKLVEAEQQAKAKGASRSAAIKAAFDRFYKGDIAEEFDRFFRENGGVMRASDLAAYEPRWSEPLHTTYRGYDVFSNPSTSRGGFEVLMQASLVEGFDLRSFGPQSAEGAARGDRSHQGGEGRHLPLRRRSEVHEHSDRGDALEGLRIETPRAHRPGPGGRVSGSGRAGRDARRAHRRPAADRRFPRSTTPSSTRRASRSSMGSATRSASRPPSAASSATTSSSATPGCC